MKQKMQPKDLITVGIFSAIMFIVCMGVAMLGYIPIFIPLLSVLVPLIGGIPFMEQENQRLAEGILDSLDLLEFKDMHPMSLSGGQKQRLAVASALASDREIIVLDEPTSGLDFLHMRQVAEGIRMLRDKDRTVFIVTHDPEFIAACCTDILIMEHGRIREQYPLDGEGMGKLKKFFGIQD